MLTSLCPFKVPVPIDSDEPLLSTSIDQSSIHTIPTVFDYDVSSLFSYALIIEYNDDAVVSHFDGTRNLKRMKKRFTTAQQKLVDKIVGLGSRVFENPEELVVFAPNAHETVVDYTGTLHTSNETDVPSSYVSKPLWELCIELNALRPDRKVKFEQIFAERLDDPSHSVSRAKRMRASFYRMVVLEAAVSLGLSGLIAKYILDQDSSLSTALLASSPYVLKDIAKLHNWLRDLKEHMIVDTTTLIGHYISPLLATKGSDFLDVPISYSAQLDSNAIMCSGIKLVLNALIQRVAISNQGNFSAIWSNNSGNTNKNDMESIMRDNSEMLEELAEIECVGGIMRATNLMMSDPQFSLNALLPTDSCSIDSDGRRMSKLGLLYGERLENRCLNSPVLSAIPLTTETSYKLCSNSLLENIPDDEDDSEHFVVPPSFPATVDESDDDDHVWQVITDVLLLPLSTIRSNRQRDHASNESQQQLSRKAFIVLMHVILDCMYLSPLFDKNRPANATIKSVEDFGIQFARACGIANYSKIVISSWKIDAGVNDVLIAKTFEQMDSPILPQSLLVNALKILMASNCWEVAQELLHARFKHLFAIDPELAFFLLSAIHLRNDPLNWRESLDNCQEHVNYICEDNEITQIAMKSDQYKKFMTDLVRHHIDHLFRYASFDSSIPNSAINSVEREIWINILDEKVHDIFSQVQTDLEQSSMLLSNCQSVQFKTINVYIALLLTLCKINEAYEIDKTHREYISNSLLDNSTQSVLNDRLKLIHSFRLSLQ